MIRDRLKRLAHEALRRVEEERDASRVRVYTAPWVIDGDGIPIPDGAVAFDWHGNVLARGSASDVLADFRWAQRAELGGILMPGLVNAYAQLELGAADARLPGGLGLRRKLRALREIRQATEELDPDSREARIRAAVRRSVGAGNAAVGDVTDSLRAVPAMSREGLYGIVFHEVGSFSARKAAKALAAAAVDRAGIAPWPEGIRYHLARWESVDVEAAVRALVEVASAVLDELAPQGRDLLSMVAELGGLDERLMLLHVDQQPSRDMVRTASRARAPLVLCPRSSLHDSGKLPPLVTFLEEGCRIALGTDSPATAPDGSVLREAAELYAAFPEVPAMVLLRAAMSGGAEALGLDSVGSLEPGAAPGLLHVDTDGVVPEDPSGWLLRAGELDLSWLVRPAPPGDRRAA